jgi:hypothetical protein
VFSLAYNVGFLIANIGAGTMYRCSVTLAESVEQPQIPPELQEKLVYDPAAHTLVLLGSMTEPQQASLIAQNPYPPVKRQLADLVRRSRHRPLPLILAALIPLAIAPLLPSAREALPAPPVGSGRAEGEAPAVAQGGEAASLHPRHPLISEVAGEKAGIACGTDFKSVLPSKDEAGSERR